MVSPRDSLVRAGLYRRTDCRLGAGIRRVVADDSLWGGATRPSRDCLDDLLVYCALSVVIGGRLGNVLFYDDPGYYFSHPWEILKVWKGGMAFHGGLIGASVGIVLFARHNRTPLLVVMDLASLAAPIGIFLVRLANFIKPEAVWTSDGRALGDHLSRRAGRASPPSQPNLLEALLEGLAVFLILAMAARGGALRRRGSLLAGGFGVPLRPRSHLLRNSFAEPDPGPEDLGGGLTMGMLAFGADDCHRPRAHLSGASAPASAPA